MHGLLAGLLAILALPPLELSLAGLFWLVPWVMGLAGPLTPRLLHTLPLTLAPVFYVSAVALTEAPLTIAALLLVTVAPFMTAACLAADGSGRSSGLRILSAIVVLVLMLHGLRYAGSPVSLTLPATPVPGVVRIVNILGLLGSDLVLGLLQASTALALRHILNGRGLRSVASSGLASGCLPLMVLAGAHDGATPAPASTDASPSIRIALMETRLSGLERDWVAADGVLEDILQRQAHGRDQAKAAGADWIVWPESATPGYRQPPVAEWPERPEAESPQRQPLEILHGYIYRSPGQLGSVGIARSSDGSTQRVEKVRPLPFAEDYLTPSTGEPPLVDIDGVRVAILICSDTLRQGTVQRIRQAEAQLIVNLSGTALAAGPRLATIHRWATHLQAANANIPVVVAENGRPGDLLRPDGRLEAASNPEPMPFRLVTMAVDSHHPEHRSFITVIAAIGVLATLWGALRCHPSAITGHTGNRMAGLAVFLSLPLLFLGPPDRTSTPGWLTSGFTYQAVTSASNPDAGALALVARQFGVPAHWRDVPEGRTGSLRWLCETAGVIADGRGPVAAPAYGLLRQDDRLLAVRKEAAGHAVRFDPFTGGFHSVDPDSPMIHWLRAASPDEHCRSAGMIR